MSVSKDLEETLGLLGDTAQELGKLVQNEARLARAELTEKFAAAVLGIAYMVGAAVLGIPIFVMLLMALAAALVAGGFSPVASYLVAAGAGAVIAGVLGIIGIKSLKSENLRPTVTIEQVSRDVDTARNLAR